MADRSRVPFLVVLMGVGAAAMLVPAVTAGAMRDYEVARPFLYGSALFLVLTAGLTLATATYAPVHRAQGHLVSVIGAFVLLPVMLALPFAEAVPDTRFLNVYFEMVSSLTTTGATVFEPDRLSISLHIWRALVGWLGGFLMWVTAFAILSPMTLGGFEVTSAQEAGRGEAGSAVDAMANPSARLTRVTWRLAPVYLTLTAVLWLVLIITGEGPAVALVHALSTLSTSGITAGGAIGESGGGFAAELAIFLCLFFAVSRRTFDRGVFGLRWSRIREDREIRLALAIVALVPTFLFLRHWFAAIEIDEPFASAALEALWGGVFMVLSFLTTTGFESASWAEAQDWSGLGTPGMLFAGLAIFGGGVATTAGGVKLLRVYALYKHGLREMEKLAHPSSVAGARGLGRRIRIEGAEIAWVFFMLFAITIGVVMCALALTGLEFDEASILATAALTTTGPVADVATGTPLSYAALPDSAKLILAAAMIVGRVETLAIIALFSPATWRA